MTSGGVVRPKGPVHTYSNRPSRPCSGRLFKVEYYFTCWLLYESKVPKIPKIPLKSTPMQPEFQGLSSCRSLFHACRDANIGCLLLVRLHLKIVPQLTKLQPRNAVGLDRTRSRVPLRRGRLSSCRSGLWTPWCRRHLDDVQPAGLPLSPFAPIITYCRLYSFSLLFFIFFLSERVRTLSLFALIWSGADQ